MTSLSDTAGTIVLNYELGDYGRLEERDCGCHLGELGREGIGERYHAGMWRQTGTVEVRRETPRATRAGKVLPFQPLGSTERTTVSRS